MKLLRKAKKIFTEKQREIVAISKREVEGGKDLVCNK